MPQLWRHAHLWRLQGPSFAFQHPADEIGPARRQAPCPPSREADGLRARVLRDEGDDFRRNATRGDAVVVKLEARLAIPNHRKARRPRLRLLQLVLQPRQFPSHSFKEGLVTTTPHSAAALVAARLVSLLGRRSSTCFRHCPV
jgi:hypothetical protein